jgi:acetyltransferase-like isoleucine patch superfamily enzyme
MANSIIETLFCIWNNIKAKIFTFILSPCFNSIGRNTTIVPPFRFANLNDIKLGDNVTIHSNSWIHTICDKDVQLLCPKIIIKDNVAIGMNATISAVESIIIEENVFTARNVYISDHGHQYEDINMPIAMQFIRKKAPVLIKKNSWLGQNAVILPGVTVGRHCVIGANSIVNSDIPDFSIAAGAPARIIKRYDAVSNMWVKVSPVE